MSYYEVMFIFSPPVLFHSWIGLLNTAHSINYVNRNVWQIMILSNIFLKYEDICISGFMKASYISVSEQTLFIEFPAVISCRQQYYIIIVSTPFPYFKEKK